MVYTGYPGEYKLTNIEYILVGGETPYCSSVTPAPAATVDSDSPQLLKVAHIFGTCIPQKVCGACTLKMWNLQETHVELDFFEENHSQKARVI